MVSFAISVPQGWIGWLSPECCRLPRALLPSSSSADCQIRAIEPIGTAHVSGPIRTQERREITICDAPRRVAQWGCKQVHGPEVEMRWCLDGAQEFLAPPSARGGGSACSHCGGHRAGGPGRESKENIRRKYTVLPILVLNTSPRGQCARTA